MTLCRVVAAPSGAGQAFSRRENLGGGRIDFARAIEMRGVLAGDSVPCGVREANACGFQKGDRAVLLTGYEA